MEKFVILSRCWLLQSLLPILLFSQAKINIVGGTKFSFGKIYTATKVQKVISLKNLGTDTLVISDVAAACGCTAAMVSNTQIAPRDSGILSITFDASRFNGWVEKTIGFRTNDPALPYVSVAFTANIIRVFDVDPEYLMFNHAKVDSEMSDEIKFRNISQRTIRFLSVASSSIALTIHISGTMLAPNQETTIKCIFHPMQAGTFKANIDITTDHPEIPSYSIRVFAFVKDDHPPKPTK